MLTLGDVGGGRHRPLSRPQRGRTRIEAVPDHLRAPLHHVQLRICSSSTASEGAAQLNRSWLACAGARETAAANSAKCRVANGMLFSTADRTSAVSSSGAPSPWAAS